MQLCATLHWKCVMSVCFSLHWLPATFRIDFKVLLLVYKSLNGLGPKYIADMLTEYKQTTQISRIESVRNTKGSHKTRSPLLDILPPTVGISFQKRSDELKH